MPFSVNPVPLSTYSTTKFFGTGLAPQPIPAVGTTFTTTLNAAAASFSAALSLVTQKAVLSAVAAFTATVLRSTLKPLTASAQSFTGALPRTTLRALVASASLFAATTIRRAGKVLAAGNAAWLVTIPRQAQKNTSATPIVFAATVLKRTAREFDSAISALSGTVLRQTNKVVSAALPNFAGATSSIRVFLKTLLASAVLFAGTITKQAAKSINATPIAFSATRISVILKSLNVSTTLFTGAVVKQINKKTNAALAVFSATQSAGSIILRLISANVALFAAAVTKQSGKVLNASPRALTAALSKNIGTHLTAAIGFSATVSKSIRRTMNAGLSAWSSTFNGATGVSFELFTAAMTKFGGQLSALKGKVKVASIGGFLWRNRRRTSLDKRKGTGDDRFTW